MNSSSNQNQRSAGNPPTLTSGNEPLFLSAVDEKGQLSHFFVGVPWISLTGSFPTGYPLWLFGYRGDWGRAPGKAGVAFTYFPS
jgi:hypothetical protein